MFRSCSGVSALIILALAVHWAQAQELSNQRDILWTAAPAGRTNLQIWRMGPDGSNPRRVGGEEAVVGNFAVWSPDGTQIIFVSYRGGRRGIFVMAADGTDIHPVGPGGDYPEWSPDGRQVLFSADGAASPDIFVMDADGSNIRQLTSDTTFDHCGHWAPDGQSVLVSAVDGNENRLMSIELATGTARSLLPDSIEGQCGVWSPDGTKIAFASGPDGQLPSVQELMNMRRPVLDIWLFDLTTSEVTQLTDNGAVTNYPRWSLDGQRLVFQCSGDEATAARGGDSQPPSDDIYARLEICTMSADGSDVRRLTNNRFFDAHPNW